MHNEGVMPQATTHHIFGVTGEADKSKEISLRQESLTKYHVQPLKLIAEVDVSNAMAAFVAQAKRQDRSDTPSACPKVKTDRD